MLPIGSIVYLKEGTSKLMILNRVPIVPTEEEDIEGVWYDYSGCFYPQGLNPNEVFYFNKENIDEVVHAGFRDGEEERFQKLFEDWEAEDKPNLKKGSVTDRSG